MPDFATIRDSPLGACIGATILDITADENEEFVADPERFNRVYFHLSNGETIYATVGVEGEDRLGLLGEEEDEE